MKRRIIVLSMVIALIVMFALPPKHAGAASLPQIIYIDLFGGRIYFRVVDLGTLFGNEWEVIAKNNLSFTNPWGLGLRFYNTSWAQAVQMIAADDTWVAEEMAFTWGGSGSAGYLSLANGFQGVANITTTPPPVDDGADSGLDLR